MTMAPYTCDDFSDQLTTFLDGDASSDVRGAMDLHAASCSACADMLQEVSAVVREAAGLPELAPARDLWSGILERIDAPVVAIGSAASHPQNRTRQPEPARRWWAHPAVAAAALVAVTAGVTHHMTKQSIELSTSGPSAAATPTSGGEGSVPGAVPTARVADGGAGTDPHDAGAGAGRGSVTGTESVGRVGAERGIAVGSERSASTAQRASANGQGSRQARGNAAGGGVQYASYRPGEIAALDSLYYREIMRLRQLLDERSTALDPSTVAVIDRNMLVIDRAIQECREALAADPASKFLNQQLNQALESKIELLRTAAMMPVGS